MTPEYLTLTDRRLAYQRIDGARGRPGVVFLGGYASDMAGTKAGFLAENCSKEGISFLRFDYRGHGLSEGDFKQGTIGAWFEDSCVAIEQLTEGPQIVIGSSMGGWLALMLAMKMPVRVKAIIGIAAAPDFTEDLMWDTFTPKQRAQLKRDGMIFDETAPPDQRAPVMLGLIEEARKHLVLRAPMKIACPVRLLQGMHDAEVPWQHALRIVEKITHDDVRLTLIKDGDHRLSRPQDLALLAHVVGYIAGGK